MNRIGFCFSGILSLLGFITLIITTFTTNLLPSRGHLIFVPQFSITNGLAIFAIIIGVILCGIFYKKSNL